MTRFHCSFFLSLFCSVWACCQSGLAQDIPIVRYRATTTDLNDNHISAVQPKTEFYLNVTVQDIRDAPTGVFSAFVDVLYDPALVSVAGPFEHLSPYLAGTSGNSTTAGLLDEVGGVDGISPLGGDEMGLFRIRMTSGDTLGTNVFRMNPADDTILHPTTVFLGTSALTPQQMVFVPASLTIVPEPLAAQLLGIGICIGYLAMRRPRTARPYG